MTDLCPHCGIKLLSVRDGFCPECRNDIQKPWSTGDRATPRLGSDFGSAEKPPETSLSTNDPANSDNVVVLGGIVFTAKRVFEGTPLRPTGAIARSRIEHIRLRHGSAVSHPILLTLFGLLMIGLGLLPLVHVLIWSIWGGIFFAAELCMLVWLVLGIASILTVVRRGFVLDIQTPTDLRKLEFRRGVTRQQSEQFVRDVERLFGYSIEIGDLSGGAETPK